MTEQDTPALRLDVLGPLRAWHDATPINLGPVQQRVVLGVLALHANRPLGREQLIDAVWASAPPAYAVNQLQKHVSALRRCLEPVRPAGGRSRLLSWTGAGYLLSVPAGGLDLDTFDRSLARARAARSAGDLPAASDALHAALRLWRGPALDGLSSPLLDAERERLAERRTGAVEDRIEVDLALGNDDDLIAELRGLIAEYPLRERLRGLLMQALYRAGRQAEALSVFRETHRFLLDELGVEPTAELRAVHQRLLQGDPAPEPPALPVPSEPPAPAVLSTAAPQDQVHRPPTPAQLPLGMADFTGRREQLCRLDELLDRSHVVAVAAIAGTAGVGKTSLAVHWAHTVSARFPGGQLYANLRGFDAHGSAVEPGEVLRGFLDAFGVPGQQIPARLEDRAALYRSLLAGRRVLVVLDNAHDTGQVQPLLPGAPGCVVVVTSRKRLAGLVAAGATPLTLDLLGVEEAHEFLRRRVGAARVAAEPAAVDDIVAACARLPLALAIVAARAAVYPEHSLGALAAELRAAGGLDPFVGEHPSDDARAVLSWSYHRLSPAAARLFRLLGLHPGPDLATPAAASLAGLPEAHTRRLLSELAGAHLIEEHPPGRFSFHDLLRAYALEQALACDSEADRRSAIRRLLDHYLHTAGRADRTLYPYRSRIDLDPADPAATVPAFGATAEALIWFLGESPVLLAAVDQAVAAGFPRHAARLAWTITAFLNYQGQWHAWAMALRAALTACRETDDIAGQALTYRLLSLATLQQGLLHDAEAHTMKALKLFDELADQAGQARLHLDYSRVLGRQEDFRSALERSELALELFRLAGDRGGEADALNWVGWFHCRLGLHERALDYCRRSLGLHRELGDSPSQADTWDALGFIHHQLGNHDAATACYEQALALWSDLGDRYEVATTMLRLGDTREVADDHDAAHKLWLQARDLLDALGHPLAGQLRERLDRSVPSPTTEGKHHV